MKKPRRKKLLFVVNPISGKGNKSKTISCIEQEMQNSDFNYEIAQTEYPQHATELAQKAAENNYYAVVAVGGDGTANEVGKALVSTDTALGIIPSGSGNGLALHLKMPLRTKDALVKIKKACVKQVDTASINGKIFLSIAGIGFDAHIGWKFAEFGKRGLMSYAQISAKEFFSYKPQQYLLEIDGKEMESNAFLISFTKSGQYGNNLWIDPSAQLDDGYISLCILEKFPFMHTLDILYKVFTKKLDSSKYFKLIKAKEIKVKKGWSKMHLDGEPFNADQELLIKVQPKSLKLIC